MTANDAIFMHEDIKGLFRNKTVIVLGDSIQRSVYKDIVCLFSDPFSGYVHDQELRNKGELCFRNDHLIRGGVKREKVNGTNYIEEREFRQGNTVFRFYFITRCWNEYVESIVNNDLTSSVKPDVIIMNSTYWDVHHYGIEGKLLYEDNLNKLFTAISILPSFPLLIWNAALPLADYCKGGFLRQGFKTLPRHEVDRANMIAYRQTKRFDFLYIDLYRSLSRHEIFQHAEDGIHWSNRAHRNMTNSILAAICQRWNMNVPVPVTLLQPRYQHLEWSPYNAQPLLPTPSFRTPSLNSRYHPYQISLLHRNTTGYPRAHQRSYTDPFPVVTQQSLVYQELRNNRYKARFMKMSSKLNTPSGTPLSRTTNNRHPLKEPNTSTTPATGASPVTKPADGGSVKGTSATEQNGSENSFTSNGNVSVPVTKPKDSESDKNSPADNGSKGCEDQCSGLKENTEDLNESVYEDCKLCGHCSVDDQEASGSNDTAAGKDPEIVSGVCHNSEKIKADSKNVDSTDSLVVNLDNDANNNATNINNKNENVKKRKRDRDDENEFQKVEKAVKLA